jgi:hypothetical protein
VRSELAASISAAESVEKATEQAASKFAFFQELRTYITELLDCLDEKVRLLRCHSRVHE